MVKLEMFYFIVVILKCVGYKEYLLSVVFIGYICCFWEVDDKNFLGNNLVVFDLCVDIIFIIDSKIGLVMDVIFVGVSDVLFEFDDESNIEFFVV